MKEAELWEIVSGNKVRCRLCSHNCVVPDGRRGLCSVRENKDGVLYSLVYGRPIARHIDPIEKKPLFHFYPGSSSYSVATAGCNFRCDWCQNWRISQAPTDADMSAIPYVAPSEIVERAGRSECRGIAYTYTEPTVFMEYAADIAVPAAEKGMYNVFVTNGYMTNEALDLAEPWLDAANVDLKGFREATYLEHVGAGLAPVLESMKTMKRLDIWLEVTTLLIPGVNDEDCEIRECAEFISKELGVETPWHISRFFPNYEMNNTPPTPEETLLRARDIGQEAGLKHIYVGNISVKDGQNTFCSKCGELLVERKGYVVAANRISDGCCAYCGKSVAGVGMG